MKIPERGRDRPRYARKIIATQAGQDAGMRVRQCRSSASDDQIHSLWAFALLVGLDFKLNSLSFGQRLQSSVLDGGDVHEDIASAIVRLDEAVPALAIEELDRTTHGHLQTPSPRSHALPPLPHGAAARLGIHNRKAASAFEASVTPP